MDHLASTLDDVRRRIARTSSRRLNEQNTKATLIEPVLRSLGWDVEDFEEVQREFRQKKRDKPVDYALLVLRTPKLFLEAKALGENLNDRRWANQIMGYASVAGVQWMVLTDGNEYRIYNTHAPVSVDEKLFRSVRIADDDELAIDTLRLLAKDRMEENRIEVLWRSQFVDKQVGTAIEQLFSGDGDLLLVNYVGQRTKNLGPEEIRASISRCQVTLDFPEPTEAAIAESTKRRGKSKPKAPSSKKTPVRSEVTLEDLIRAGVIDPPTALQRKYKGKMLSARIEKNGTVKCLGKTFDSLSSAGGAARASVLGPSSDGKHPPTNGWTFWKYANESGQLVPIGDVRAQYEGEAAPALSPGRKTG